MAFICLMGFLFSHNYNFVANLYKEQQQNGKSGFSDVEIPLPVERIDLTFYATTRALGAPQMSAIRSWLAIGANVIVFVDSNTTEITNIPSTLVADGTTDRSRFQLLQTPLPRSILGAPRLDLIMEAGETTAKTNWLCMINADIVIPSSFKHIITHTFSQMDIFAIGERLDCRVNPEVGVLPKSVNSFADLEQWSMAPCWPHGSGGKDYFLYRRGFFLRHSLQVPPFWIGKFVWDHWLVNATRRFAVDLTPSLLVGHFSHEYDWNWRTVRDKTEATKQKEIAKLDITWNQRIVHCNEHAVYSCVPFQSTYDVAYQLCPNGQIQPMPSRARELYFASVDRVRVSLKPPGLEGTRARRVYQNEALTGTSPRYWEGENMQMWAREHGCADE